MENDRDGVYTRHAVGFLFHKVNVRALIIYNNNKRHGSIFTTRNNYNNSEKKSSDGCYIY